LNIDKALPKYVLSIVHGSVVDVRVTIGADETACSDDKIVGCIYLDKPWSQLLGFRLG